jgi:hypothetical protein
MDRSWPGHERLNDSLSSESEDESSDSEAGVQLSTQSLRSPKSNAQFASPATLNALGYRKEGCEWDMVGFTHSFSQLQDLLC